MYEIIYNAAVKNNALSRTSIIEVDNSYSYADLFNKVEFFSKKFKNLSNHIIFIKIKPSFDYIALILACNKLKICFVPIDSNFSDEQAVNRVKSGVSVESYFQRLWLDLKGYQAYAL